MHTMHLLPGVAIQPNLDLKAQPKQLLGSLPLVIALPRKVHYSAFLTNLVGWHASAVSFPQSDVILA
jgi:hypothetical protein